MVYNIKYFEYIFNFYSNLLSYQSFDFNIEKKIII